MKDFIENIDLLKLPSLSFCDNGRYISKPIRSLASIIREAIQNIKIKTIN